MSGTAQKQIGKDLADRKPEQQLREEFDSRTSSDDASDSDREPESNTEAAGKHSGRSIGVTILPGAVLSEADLAQAFQKHPVTIKRAIERGELPLPVRLMGKPTWTGAVILKHLEGRLARAREEAEIFQRHRAHLPKDNLK